MKKIFKGFAIILSLTLILVLACIINFSIKFPDNFNITNTSGKSVNSFIPITIKSLNTSKAQNSSTFSQSKKQYNAELMLMNSIPIKNVSIQVTDDVSVIPCGTPFGIKLFTEGVVVVGLSDVKTSNGIYNPAKLAGIKKGDVIISMNNVNVRSNEDVANIIENSKGNDIKLIVKRDNNEFESTLKPLKSTDDDAYKIGIWVRDSSAGIGTMTFINPKTNVFAGLGHGICDVDTGELLPLSHGDIISAKIEGLKPGQKGDPGELKGIFHNNDTQLGTLRENTITGVYGCLKKNIDSKEKMVVAMKQQIKTGDANILTTISGDKPSSYSIKIKSVNYNELSPTKNMVVEITDPDLLNQTGGIVQGMSGSPIIQNEKLVGAITHVFVNDPKKGYAIFAENMLNSSSLVDCYDNQIAS